MKQTHIFYGREMHTKISGPENDYFQDIWEWPSEQEEQSIKDDVLYTVVCEVEEWDTTGSIVGDSVGRRRKVIAFEETSRASQDLLEEVEKHDAALRRLWAKLNTYKAEFAKRVSNK